MRSEAKEYEELLREVKRGLRPEPKKYPPKLTKRGRPRLYQSEAEGARVRYRRKKGSK